MSSRRELYKEKSRGGLGSREARGRLKAQESKSGRDALLLSRRRIPLSAVQEDRTQKTENGALSASQKSLSRLQKLQEWKKKRDEVKEKEKASKTKLPPFHGGGRGIATNAPVHISKPLQFQPPRVGKASVSHKSATYGKQTSSTSSSSSTKLASNTTSASTKVGKTSTKSLAAPPTSLTETQKVVEKGSSKMCPPSTGVLPPAVEESRRTLRSKPPVVLRASKRISSLKEKKEELKAKPAPARKERVAKPPTSSRGGRSTDTSTQTARNGRKLRDREETVAMPEGVVPSRRSGRKVLAKGVGTDTALPAKEKASKKKVAPVKMKLAYSESSSDSNETSPKLSPGLRYASPPPSVEVERGQLSTASPFVLPLSGPPQLPPSPSPATCIPDSAWILTTNSYALLPPPPHPCRTPGKTVEDVLGPCTFSPFAFTAGTAGVGGAMSDTHSVSKRRATPGKPFVFNFMKAVEGTPMSLRVEALCGGGGDVSSDNISVDSLDCDPAPTVAASSDDVVTKETDTEVKMTEIVATATDPVPSVAEEPIEVSEMVTVATEPVAEQNELFTETEVVAMTETVAMPTDVSEETEVLATQAEVVSETTGKEYTTPKVPIPISSLANMGVAAWCGVPVVRGGVESEGDTEAVLPESENQQEVTENEKDGVDLDYFRKVHDDVVDILTGKCSEWRAKNETVEAEKEREGVEEERCKILEEAVDQIRTTVLQAELLMRKKMKQYLGLVDNAATDGGKTGSDDLQGFWDLVYIQVEVLYRKFDDLTEYEQNNWQPAQTSKTVSKKKGKKRVAGGAKSGGKSTSEKQTAAKEKREAMRSRLREMKMAAAAKRAREGGEEEESKLQEQEPSSKKVKDSPATSDTVAMATSDSAHPNDHITPPRSDGHHDNSGCRSDQRKSTGRNRHRSRRLDSGKSVTASLIDFSQPPADEESSHTTAEAVSITLNPSGFSPSQCDTAVFYEAGESEVPTAQLLSFNDQPVMSSTLPPLKSPLKWIPKGMSRMTSVKKQVTEGASLRCFVSITPSKRVRDVLEADVIMSPARRSLRIAEKFCGASDKAPGNYQVSSLGDLPDGLDIGYLPNKALL